MSSRHLALSFLAICCLSFLSTATASACGWLHCRCHHRYGSSYNYASYPNYYAQMPAAAPTDGAARFTIDDIGRVIELLRNRPGDTGVSPPVQDVTARVDRLQLQVDRHEVDISNLIQSQGDIVNALDNRYGIRGGLGGSPVMGEETTRRIVKDVFKEEGEMWKKDLSSSLTRELDKRYQRKLQTKPPKPMPPKKDKESGKGSKSETKTKSVAKLVDELEKMVGDDPEAKKKLKALKDYK